MLMLMIAYLFMLRIAYLPVFDQNSLDQHSTVFDILLRNLSSFKKFFDICTISFHFNL